MPYFLLIALLLENGRLGLADAAPVILWKRVFYYSDTDMVTCVNMYSEPASNDSSISDLVPDSRQELQSFPRRFWPFWRLIWGVTRVDVTNTKTMTKQGPWQSKQWWQPGDFCDSVSLWHWSLLTIETIWETHIKTVMTIREWHWTVFATQAVFHLLAIIQTTKCLSRCSLA